MTVQETIEQLLTVYDTQSEIAELTGINEGTLSRILNGKTNEDKILLSTAKAVQKLYEDTFTRRTK